MNTYGYLAIMMLSVALVIDGYGGGKLKDRVDELERSTGKQTCCYEHLNITETLTKQMIMISQLSDEIKALKVATGRVRIEPPAALPEMYFFGGTTVTSFVTNVDCTAVAP